MITNQPVDNHDDLRKVTDNILRDAGMTIEDSGGKVTIKRDALEMEEAAAALQVPLQRSAVGRSGMRRSRGRSRRRHP